MQSKYLNKLEYNKILEILSKYAHTYIGKKLCLELSPSKNKDKVQKALDETTEAVSLKYRKGTPPISYIDDISVWLKSLESNKSLSAKAILEIGLTLKMARELKEYFFSNDTLDINSFKILNNYFYSLYTNETLEKQIFHDIIDEYTISDNASKKLYSIRKDERKTEQGIKDKLNSFIHSSTYSKFIQESVVTIRNDRYVIPVKSEYRSSIKGFIHDISSSGSTVFIEPMAVFDLNNELNSLKIEENIEIEKILANISSNLVPLIEDLRNNVRLIGRLDFIFAKANYSIYLDCTSPILNNKPIINLIKARHPLINKEKVVPIDVPIGIDYSCLVITGPNTGGKTVTLKTVGLLCLMGMSGLHIPAKENSSIYVFDNIFSDIGDDQSIQESLSTFSSHMKNIIEITENCTSDSLILVDELGSGTDPLEGSSLAISILEYFHNFGSLTLATTHYPEIKNYALTTPGFKNASQEFDVEHLCPTYKLLIGIPGRSNAFAISEKLGLNSSILKRANEFISKDTIHIEELLKSIYNDKKEIESMKEKTEKNLSDLETLKKTLEKDNSDVKNKEIELIENAKLEARDILLEAKEEATKIIREMKTISKNELSTKKLDNLRNSLNDSLKSLSSNKTSIEIENSLEPNDIQIGMDVFVNTIMQDGKVISLPNKSNEVTVQIGSLKINVKISALTKSSKNTNSSKNSTQKTIVKNQKPQFKSKDIVSEINVIGLTAYEAIPVVDKYIDDCSLSTLKKVRIVHGKGTGKLREAIHAFLKKNKFVKSYRLGTFGEGEMGVTIVELK